MSAKRSRCADHGITGLEMQLFNLLESPILGYCSEVWAPALLHSSGSGPSGVRKALSHDMQLVQFMLFTSAGWAHAHVYMQAVVLTRVWLPAFDYCMVSRLLEPLGSGGVTTAW
jgi:hypothetical protein